jgi:RND family efflux transporter MFP subunit
MTSRKSPHTRAAAAVIAGIVIATEMATPAAAQPAGLVRYTEVVEHRVRGTIALPGSVESRRSSVVAAEVRGLVVAMEVQEGDRVEERQPLARLRTIFLELELRAAEGRLKEARARLQLAESKLGRTSKLFEESIISQDEQDDAHSAYTAWQGRVEQTEAEIASLEVALDRCIIRAPFAGTVVSERTDVGQWINEGGPVVEMVAPGELEVRMETPERYYDQIRRGVPADVRFAALPGIGLEGRVSRVIPRADAQSRSFPVKVVIPNPDGRVAVGMLAEVSVPAGRAYDALLVPKDALVRRGGGEIVFRINGDDTVEPVPIESRQGVGAWIVVSGPLAAGDRVVVRGNERLVPGQPVQGERQEYPLP